MACRCTNCANTRLEADVAVVLEVCMLYVGVQFPDGLRLWAMPSCTLWGAPIYVGTTLCAAYEVLLSPSYIEGTCSICDSARDQKTCTHTPEHAVTANVLSKDCPQSALSVPTCTLDYARL